MKGELKMKNPLSILLKNYYKWKIIGAKRQLSGLSEEKSKIMLDLESLGIDSKVDCTLYVNPKDEGLSVDIFAWRFREPINTYTLSRFISEQKQSIDAVVDIGSNIGYFPLVELASGAQRVVAIEPVPETFAFLKKNLTRFSNSKTLNVAVSHRKGTLKMYVPTKLNLATVLTGAALTNVKNRETSIKEVIEVPSLSLRDIIEMGDLKRANILVRMDVEGFEKNIIENLPKEVFALSFELHSYILGYESAFAVIERLYKLGYRIQTVVRESGGLSPIVKLFGIEKTLHFYAQATNKKRIIHNPGMTIIKDIIKQQKECPHIFAVKCQR